MDVIRKILDSWGEEYKSFFDPLLSLTPAQRQYFLRRSFFEHLHLCQFLQLVTENHCESQAAAESYQEDVKSAFESENFETLSAGYMAGSEVVHHSDPEL